MAGYLIAWTAFAALATLAQCGQVKRKAADILGVSLKTLYNRLEVYNGRHNVDAEVADVALRAGHAVL